MNRNREVWEGWTVQNFIDDIEPIFRMIQEGKSWYPAITSEGELKKWLIDEQPYYKKHIPEVFEYFREQL